MQNEIEDTEDTQAVVDVSDVSEVSAEPVDESDEKFISQRELDRILQKRLKRQEDQLLKKYSDYEQRVSDSEAFRKLQDEKATDAERWEKEREKLNALLKERDEKLTTLERSNLIADLASERGLPKSFWKRVQGSTEEEIAEDMDSIIKDLGLDVTPGEGKTTPKPAGRKAAVYGGGGVTEDPEPDTDAIVARIPRGPQIRVERPRSYK
ncbi:MAG: hypothetical protein ACKODT_08030 [Fluviibacter sp.]